MTPGDVLQESPNLWIFGYGSLVWKPDFQYRRRKVGFIRGYKRRFWHGDNFHRGNEKKPGRVVTLVEDHEASTWGVAYEVTGSQVQESLSYLGLREVVLGGYVTKTVEFTPRPGQSRADVQGELQGDEDDDADDVGHAPVHALVYIATEDNPIYLGPASAGEIAAQIASSRGSAGPNMEYLLRLAHFMHTCCPEVTDTHLFDIEEAAHALLVRHSG